MELAGVRIDDFGVREALARAEEYLDNETVDLIETVTMKTVAAAAGDEKIRACLKEMTMVLPGDKEILQMAGIDSEERIREVEERLFFYEFMKLAIEHRKTFFVLSGTEKELEELLRFLYFLYGDEISICGQCALSSRTGEEEDLINEINGALPGVILSTLPSPRQEYFLQAHKNEIHAEVWYGISAEYDLTQSRKGLRTWLKKRESRFQMQRQMEEYEDLDDRIGGKRGNA